MKDQRYSEPDRDIDRRAGRETLGRKGESGRFKESAERKEKETTKAIR